MKVICPLCNVPMEMSDVVNGSNIKCATCNNVFQAGATPPPPEATPVPKPVLNENIKRTPCPFCQHMVAEGAKKCPNCKGTIGAIACPSCREPIPANTISCPHCQTQIQKAPAAVPKPVDQPKRKCPSCQERFPVTEAICRTCRVPLGPVPQSKILCGLIALLVPIGIHRFLMGYTTIGILQVIVVTISCGIGVIWPMIEGLMIFTDSLKMADGEDLLDT